MYFLSYILIVNLSMAGTAAKEEHVTLLFAGDISFSGPVKYHVEQNYHSYNESFNEVASFIRKADISVANLESPFVSKDVYPYKFKGKKSTILDSSPEAVSALRFAGFDVITIANNHMNDFGSEGATNTAQVLKEAGFEYFGISYGKFGSTQKYAILERKGIRIGFLGYCDHVAHPGFKNCTQMRTLFSAGPAVYQESTVNRDVKALKQANVDVIVVFMHWGKELLPGPLPYQLDITKHLVSLGVQVIIGAHPHFLQPHCMHGNTVVAFSLANFLFPPLRLLSGNDPALYGEFGLKPDKYRIKIYEHYVLGNKVFRDLSYSRLFQVTVSRSGVQRAKYLPIEIAFDSKTKRLHPKPRGEPKWVSVCGRDDKHCMKCNF